MMWGLSKSRAPAISLGGLEQDTHDTPYILTSLGSEADELLARFKGGRDNDGSCLILALGNGGLKSIV